MPLALAWVVEQCLAKDPANAIRRPTISLSELRRVRDRLRDTHNEPENTDLRQSRPWRPVAMVAAAVLASTAIGVATLGRGTPSPDLRFTPIASQAVYEGTPVWSPGGESLAWVADVDGVLQIFVRRLADAVATQLTRGRFDAEQPFWSPDGKGLYFISRAGDGMGLWTVGSAGGRAELLLQNVTAAAIDPAGKRFALLRMEDDAPSFCGSGGPVSMVAIRCARCGSPSAAVDTDSVASCSSVRMGRCCSSGPSPPFSDPARGSARTISCLSTAMPRSMKR